MPGVVDTLDHGEWQAHVQMRLNGKNVHVRGPRRTAQEKRKAEFDLAMIQEAGDAVDGSKSKDAVLSAMMKTAQILKSRCECEYSVARHSATLSNVPFREASKTAGAITHNNSSRDGSDDSAWVAADLPEDRAGDVDEPWQSIDDARYFPECKSGVKRIMLKPKDYVEATALLSKCLPCFYTPTDLSMLLNARADPNVIVGNKDVSPLQKIITFAQKGDAAEMRDLLLRAGAVETFEMKQDWMRRRYVEEHEAEWLCHFHSDPR